jgi:hypothetical protein
MYQVTTTAADGRVTEPFLAVYAHGDGGGVVNAAVATSVSGQVVFVVVIGRVIFRRIVFFVRELLFVVINGLGNVGKVSFFVVVVVVVLLLLFVVRLIKVHGRVFARGFFVGHG